MNQPPDPEHAVAPAPTTGVRRPRLNRFVRGGMMHLVAAWVGGRIDRSYATARVMRCRPQDDDADRSRVHAGVQILHARPGHVRLC